MCASNPALAMSLVVVLEPEKSFFGRSFELWDRWCRWTHGDAAERIVWSAVHLYGARRLTNSSPGDTVAFDEERPSRIGTIGDALG